VSAHGRPLIIGHSHAGALFDAAASARLDTDNFSFWLARDAYRLVGEDVILGDDLGARVDQATHVLSAIGGGSCRVVALMNMNRAFDFVDPHARHAALDRSAELVPFAAVRAAVARQEALPMALLRAIAKRAKGPVVHLTPPRPTPRWEGPAALELSKKTAALLGIAHTPELDAPHLHTSTRKVWEVMLRVHREVCHELAIDCVAQPPETEDDDGCLREDFAQDPMHGNARYGRAVLASLGMLAGGPLAVPRPSRSSPGPAIQSGRS
jgi:hypothetical protein